MSKHDKNKGYQWFRFQKDSAIDSALPPLTSYRSMRELNPILWMSNAEHVAKNERGHVHSDSGSVLNRTHDTSSLHLLIILAGSISNAFYRALSVNANEAGIAYCNTEYGNSDTLAFPLYMPTPTRLLGSDTGAASQQSVVKKTPVRKTRTKLIHVRKSTRERPNNGKQTDLQDCFPLSSKGFLSAEKELDI